MTDAEQLAAWKVAAQTEEGDRALLVPPDEPKDGVGRVADLESGILGGEELIQGAFRFGIWIDPSLTTAQVLDKVELIDEPELGETELTEAKALWREQLHPRDWHGRWSRKLGGRLVVPQPLGPKWSQPGGSWEWPPEKHPFWPAPQIQAVQRAVDHALARDPELVGGDHPLSGVAWTSTSAPPGVDADEWERLRRGVKEHHAPAATADIEGPHAPFVMVDDETRFAAGSNMAAATRTPYGTVTHELGHALFISRGVVSNDDAKTLLREHDITPRDLEMVGSRYGASMPHEALAELYTMANVPESEMPGWDETSSGIHRRDLERWEQNDPRVRADYEHAGGLAQRWDDLVAEVKAR